MSALLIVTIEGVLTKLDDDLPTADPHLAGISLVLQLAERWPVGYVTSAPADLAAVWLQEVKAPAGLFIESCDPPTRSEAILGVLGRRGDRCQFLLAGSTDGFATLLSSGVSTLFYRHESFLTTDWRMRSSWSNPDEEDRNKGSVFHTPETG